jgi:hypothetical protein
VIGQIYNVIQIWPGRSVCKQVTVCPGHIWTTLYIHTLNFVFFFPLPQANFAWWVIKLPLIP